MKPKYYVASAGSPIYFKVIGDQYWTRTKFCTWLHEPNEAWQYWVDNYSYNFSIFKEISYEDLILELL